MYCLETFSLERKSIQDVNTEKGQTKADVSLYHQFASHIFAYIYRLVSSSQDAEDVLLDVFMAAFNANNLAELSQEQQVTWLQQVARYKVIDLYRRRIKVPSLPLEYAAEVIDRELTPEQQALQREASQLLHKTLAQLPLLEQQVIHLRFGNGLRFTQIAEILDKPEGSLRALLSRTLRHLRTLYSEERR